VSELKKRIEDIIVPELSVMGMELVDLELASLKGKNILRLYIDKNGETSDRCILTVGDCENVSNAVQRLLDVEAIFVNIYTLEVSTPGIERPLRKLADFERFKSKLCKVTLKEPLENETFFEGRIKEVSGNSIIFDVTGKNKTVEFTNIKKSKLKYER
jgi:ribosome maturation factor RimP